MARSSWLQRLARRFQQAAPKRPAQRTSRPLTLERLEDRTVPTVVFKPAFGPEVVKEGEVNGQGGQVITQPIASNPTVLKSPSVYFFFWGKSWTVSTARRFVADAETVFNSSYFGPLKDYGSEGGVPTYGGGANIDSGYLIDNTAPPGPSNPITATAEIQSKLPNTSFQKPQSTSSIDSPIYVVVFDTGGAFGNGGDNYTPPNSSTPLRMNHIWMGMTSAHDETTFTVLLSHEVAERIFDGAPAHKHWASIHRRRVRPITHSPAMAPRSPTTSRTANATHTSSAAPMAGRPSRPTGPFQPRPSSLPTATRSKSPSTPAPTGPPITPPTRRRPASPASTTLPSTGTRAPTSITPSQSTARRPGRRSPSTGSTSSRAFPRPTHLPSTPAESSTSPSRPPPAPPSTCRNSPPTKA